MAGNERQAAVVSDPIALEILWNRLISIVDESAVALVRTSLSPVVRESNDFGCAILDGNGDSVAENTLGIPSFLGTMPRTMKYFLAAAPLESWKPGNVMITNDPWLAAGHIFDVAMASPVFHQDRLVGFHMNVAHMVDMGGLGRTAIGRSVYEEGLRIPPMWLMREGELNGELLTLLRANVRVPDEVVGELMARVTTGLVCARQLDEFLTEQRLEDLSSLSRALQERAEASMRRAIEKIPDGSYHHELVADGFDAEFRIRIALTVRGSDILVDYTGSSPEQDRALNSVMNYTFAYTAYPIKCALDPFTPKNEGSFRPISVFAPEGCVLNPRFPAPVTARSLSGHYLSQAVFGALAQVIPEKIMAESGSAPAYRAHFMGQDEEGKPFSTTLFAAGGTGARKGLDGLDCTAFPTNSILGSLEAIESVSPVRFEWRRVRTDSGGPGKQRGGWGQYMAVSVDSPYPCMVAPTVERMKRPARGLVGGLPGAPADLKLNDGQYLHPKARSMMAAGDVVRLFYPGGGGYGDPRERDRAGVLMDLEDGIITREAAAEFYGVVPAEGEIAEEPDLD